MCACVREKSKDIKTEKKARWVQVLHTVLVLVRSFEVCRKILRFNLVKCSRCYYTNKRSPQPFSLFFFKPAHITAFQSHGSLAGLKPVRKTETNVSAGCMFGV